MRQLDTCDFCDEPPEGVYEVVPAGVADGPRRLALCATCRDTLRSVVDPLLDVASSDGERSEPSEEASGEAASSQAGSESPDVATRESGRETSTDEESSGASESVAADGTSAADVTDPSTDSTTDKAPSSATSETEPAGAETGGTGGTPAERPDGYAQVLRLLQNRDEAIARDDLRTLATNAYDVSERTFERALDAAIEQGDVEETNAGLRTV